MSDKPISVGDLVVVVRHGRCCNLGSALGTVFTVADIKRARLGKCLFCGAVSLAPSDFAMDGRDGLYVEIRRLKRIPPLSELDDVKRDEEITA